MVERAAFARADELARRVLRSKLARAAVVVLWLLGASAIYAPLIANGEPLYLRAIDRGACERALDTLEPLVEEWALALLSGRAGESDSAAQQRVAASREAVLLRVDTLRTYAPRGAFADELAGFAARMDAAHSGFRSQGISGAASGLVELRSSAARARGELDTLVPVRSAPALEALSRLDVLTMLLLPALTLFALLGRLRQLAWMPIAIAFVIVLLWPFVFVRPAFASRPVKAAIASGELIVESAAFAPIPFGIDETNSSEVLRPPTWLASSEIDGDGRYMRGPRGAPVEPASGFTPAPNPVRVLPHEPARNSGLRHVLGTDSLGRDVLARLVWGARASLGIGLAGAALVVAIGLALGAVAGWFGRWTDLVLSRVIEVFSSFPAIFVIVVVAALIPARSLDPRLAIPLVVGLIGWTSVARLVRGEVHRVKALEHVAAARVLGYSDLRVLARHVLPNAIQPVIVAAAFLVGWGIFVEAGVSFLGFGVEAPTPSWGNLLDDSREHWWIQVFPGAAIAGTVLALHVLGEALRDALDPRLVVVLER